ncbi:MAG: formate dehydrogenase accessory sulfurtransferase FdhD [Syntrophales bacterium]
MKNGDLPDGVVRLNIRSYEGVIPSDVRTTLIRETSLDIVFNGERLISLACTGNHLKELAIGYVRSEGLITTSEDIRAITVSKSKGSVRISTGRDALYGLPTRKVIGSSGARFRKAKKKPLLRKMTPGPVFSPDTVYRLMKGLLLSSKLHDVTRGTHCSALADSRKIIAAREDIGRHNTIDMLGGFSLLNKMDCSDKIILTTGRISSEIITKISRMGISVVISHSAPTSMAVELAASEGITLIGYVRGGKFRIYTHRERIIDEWEGTPG